MKIKTFINNEVKQYQKEVVKNKKKGVNLDKLQSLMWKHNQNCKTFIDYNCIDGYSKKCDYETMARNELQKVDDTEFGYFNSYGQCIGYDFYRQ